MITADHIRTVSFCKRKRRESRQSLRCQIRKMSRKLVKTGEIPPGPCLVCGSEENPSIHHVGHMRPGKFVFVCVPCRVRAHRARRKLRDRLSNTLGEPIPETAASNP